MRKAVVAAFILVFSISFSQNYKFGKVSKEELKEKSYAEDSEVNAAFLYKYRKSYYEYEQDEGFVLVTKIHERVKIYNKKGSEYATKKINLYKNKRKSDEFTSLKAYTYFLENDKVEKIKLEKREVYTDEKSKYLDQKVFTLPNINDGCVIEYQYIIRSPFHHRVGIFNFQHLIPIKKLKASIEIPEYFTFKKNTKGFFKVNAEETSRNGKINFTTKSLPKVGGRIEVYENELEFKTYIDLYEMKDIPALKKEIMVRNLDNYRSAIKYELSFTKFPNSTYEYYSTTWEDVVKGIYEGSEFGGQLNKVDYFKADIDALIEDVNEPLEKAALIYNYVKKKIKFNDYIGYYTNVGVKKAYKEGVGNLAEINLALVAMLRYAGLNASPVLVSTKNNGVPLFPTRQGFNYVIAAIEVPEDVILLDGANKYGTANILSEDVINWQGRIVRKQGSSAWIDLTPKRKSKEVALMNVNIADDLSISGKIKKHLTDYLALSYRDRYYDSKNESIVSSYEKDKGDIEITNLEVKNKKELSKPVNYTYDFKLDNAIEEIGDKLYISPLLFLASEENPFKQETRIYPIDFIYPTYSKYAVYMKIPEGYVVESLPKNAKVQFNGTEGEFSYIIREQGETIQVSVVMDLKKTLILPEEYLEFKKFFGMSHEKQAEKIVLKKQ